MRDDLFSSFLTSFSKVGKQRYEFVEKLRANVGSVLPKKSSFYLGVSPLFRKHVIVNFQQSKKARERDDFTINVHISQTIALTQHFAPFRREEFARFEDGYYRLPTMVGRDRWWCPSGRAQVSNLVEHWVPSVTATNPVAEAVEDVLEYLRRHLLSPAGFVPH